LPSALGTAPVLVESTKLMRIQIVYIAQNIRMDFEPAAWVSTVDLAAAVWLANENTAVTITQLNAFDKILLLRKLVKLVSRPINEDFCLPYRSTSSLT
jgi:hypothetical protein